MACRTASVKRGAGNVVKAIAALEELEKVMDGKDSVYKTDFSARIDDSLKAANIHDAELMAENSAIKTEYSSEFNIDAIAKVITTSLTAVNAAIPKPTDPKAFQSSEAIEAYADVVNSIAEAAKSSSQAAASLSYSMNRLGPGIFAFVMARSETITDQETFGTESVSSTAIYYRYVRSNQSLQNDAKFEATKMLMAHVLAQIDKWIKMQAALLDDLGNDKVTMELYETKDEKYDEFIAKQRAKMEHTEGVEIMESLAAAKPFGSSGIEELVGNVVKTLSSKGDAYKEIVGRAEARLSSGHFWGR
jgi:hypothetical protein